MPKRLEQPLDVQRMFDEERLRLLSLVLDQTSEGIALTDLEGYLIFVNRAFAELHGYEPAEVIGEHLRVFHSPEQIPSVDAAIRQVRETGKFAGEIRHMRRDGMPFASCMRNTLLRDEADRPIGIIGTMRDVTEQKHAEDALRESEQLYRTLVETSPEAVTMSDLNGIITFVSARTLELHGCRRSDEIVGHAAFEFVAPEDRERAVDGMKLTLARGILRDREYTLLRADGSRFDGELHASVVRDASGEPKAFIATVRDISDRKQADSELRMTTRHLEAEQKKLLEKNVALAQVLDHIEQQRQDYKQRICQDIEQAIIPVLERFRLNGTDENGGAIENLEENIKSILHRDIDVIQERLSRLTPRELDVCRMIKQGRSSKEIADVLNLALTTIHTHRQQIRKKLGLAKKGVNLSTYLRIH